MPVTVRSVELLGRTRPWVLFFAILSFIGTGLWGVGAIVLLVMAVWSPRAAYGAGVAFAYVILAALTAIPAIALMKYASRIGVLTRMRRAVDLEEALDAQRSYWKSIGIIVIVILGLYIGVGGIAVIATVLR